MCHLHFLEEFNTGYGLKNLIWGKKLFLHLTCYKAPNEIICHTFVCQGKVVNKKMWAYDLKFS